MPITPGSLASLTAVVVVSQIGLTFLAMTCQAFMGTCLTAEEKGRGAGWYQAGAFVGGGAGGGAALFLAQHLEGWQAAASRRRRDAPLRAATPLGRRAGRRGATDPSQRRPHPRT